MGPQIGPSRRDDDDVRDSAGERRGKGGGGEGTTALS